VTLAGQLAYAEGVSHERSMRRRRSLLPASSMSSTRHQQPAGDALQFRRRATAWKCDAAAGTADAEAEPTGRANRNHGIVRPVGRVGGFSACCCDSLSRRVSHPILTSDRSGGEGDDAAGSVALMFTRTVLKKRSSKLAADLPSSRGWRVGDIRRTTRSGRGWFEPRVVAPAGGLSLWRCSSSLSTLGPVGRTRLLLLYDKRRLDVRHDTPQQPPLSRRMPSTTAPSTSPSYPGQNQVKTTRT
jgi:hypothetical protein